MNICIDFDGTIADHCFPHIGEPVPGAFEYMKWFQGLGANLILFTMRSDNKEGDFLSDAIAWCKERGIEFYGHNENPGQESWTTSPKPYAPIYIDDAAFGCPMIKIPTFARPCVDWSIVGPGVLNKMLNR